MVITRRGKNCLSKRFISSVRSDSVRICIIYDEMENILKMIQPVELFDYEKVVNKLIILLFGNNACLTKFLIPKLVSIEVKDNESRAWASYDCSDNVIKLDFSIDPTNIVDMEKDYINYCLINKSSEVVNTEKVYATEVTLLHELGHWKQSLMFDMNSNEQMDKYIPERLIEYHNIVLHENRYTARQRKSYINIEDFISYLNKVQTHNTEIEYQKAKYLKYLFDRTQVKSLLQLDYALRRISAAATYQYKYARRAMDDILYSLNCFYDKEVKMKIMGNLLYELALSNNRDAIKAILSNE